MQKKILALLIMLLLTSSMPLIPTVNSDDYKPLTDIATGTLSPTSERVFARASNGTLYAVYYTGGYSDGAIFLISSEDNGATWTEGMQVDDGIPGQYCPTMAIDGNDSIYIFWSGSYSEGSYHALRCRFYQGGSWGEVMNLTDIVTDVFEQSCPSVAIDSHNNVHVVWWFYEEMYTGNEIISYMMYNGTSFSSQINISDPLVDNIFPAITIDKNNNIYVFWETQKLIDVGEGIQYAFHYSSNNTWSSVKTLYDFEPPEVYFMPTLAVDINNVVHVAYINSSLKDEGGLENGTVEHLTITNFVLSAPEKVSDSGEVNVNIVFSFPGISISTDYQGHMYVLWDGLDGSTPVIMLSEHDSIWSEPQILVTDTELSANANLIYYPSSINLPWSGYAFLYNNDSKVVYYQDVMWTDPPPLEVIHAGGLTVQRTYQYDANTLLRRSGTFENYGGTIWAMTSDNDYVYVAGATTNKVYQYWKTNMTKKAETASYGGIIYALAQDDTYVYAGGATTNKVYKYQKSDMSKVAETLTYGGTIRAIAINGTYLYAGGETTLTVRQYWTSNMTYNTQTASYGGIIYALAADDTYVYAGGATTLTVRQYWTSNMTYNTQTASYGGIIYALAQDDTYVYAGGATTLTVRKYQKSDMTYVTQTASYGGIIQALTQNNTCIYVAGATTCKIYRYLKSDMSKNGESGQYGATIYALDLSITEDTQSATVYVDDNAAPSWYDASHVLTIPEAVANVTRGGLIYIYNGTYTNTITAAGPNLPGSTVDIIVYKNITIQGESQASVIIDAQTASNGILVYHVNGTAIIENLTVQNWLRRGIAQYIEPDPIIVRNNTIIGPDTAGGNGNCIMFSGNNSLIEYNTCYGTTIANGASGILCYSSSNSVIRHNYVRNKVDKVTDNGIVVCSYYYTAGTYEWNLYAGNNTVENNTVENVSQSGILIAGWESNVTVQYNTVTNCSKGIDVWMYIDNTYAIFKKPTDIFVRFNNITQSQKYGITVLSCEDGIYIENNSVNDGSGDGIVVQSLGVIVANNTVINNTGYGIERYTADNLIYNNYFDNIKNANELLFAEYTDTALWGVPTGNGTAYYPCILTDFALNFSSHGNSSKYKMWYDDGANHVTQILSSDGITWGDVYVCTGLSGTVTHPKIVYDENGFNGTNYYYRLFYTTNSGGSTAITSMKIMDSVDGLAWENLRSMTQSANSSQMLCGNTVPTTCWSYQTAGAAQVFYNASYTNIGNDTDWKGDDDIWSYQWVMYYDVARSGGTSYEAEALAYSSDGLYFIRYGVGDETETKNTTIIQPDIYWESLYNGYAYHLSTIRYDNKWVGWYSGGINAKYYHGIGFATSTNGLNWTKSPGYIYHISDGVTWRASRTYNPCVVLNETGTIFMYFTGDGASGRGIGLFIQSDGTWNTTKTVGINIHTGPYLGGNYWSDYTGVDNTGDGLGDTLLPYNSSLSGTINMGGDWEPLVNCSPNFGIPTPTDGAINQPVSLTWTINITDYEGDAITSWTLECSNGQTATGAGTSPQTASRVLSGLSYSTLYTVWVNASDSGSGGTTRESFTFTTITLSNTPPGPFSNEIPANESSYLSVYNEHLRINCADADNDSLTITFYWSNDIEIANTTISAGEQANIFLPDYISPQWLPHQNTEPQIEWYATANDGFDTVTSGTYWFTTSYAWDCNEDMTIDFIDISALSGVYGNSVTAGSIGPDINNDGIVDFIDVSSLSGHYGESY